MQVVDRLPRIAAAIDHHSVSPLTEIQLASDIANRRPKMRDQFVVGLVEGIDRDDGLLGNHQNMCWRLWIHIPKRQAEIILVDNIRRNFPIDDPLKNGHVARECEAGRGVAGENEDRGK